MKKRLLSMLLTVALTLSSLPVALATSVSADVEAVDAIAEINPVDASGSEAKTTEARYEGNRYLSFYNLPSDTDTNLHHDFPVSKFTQGTYRLYFDARVSKDTPEGTTLNIQTRINMAVCEYDAGNSFLKPIAMQSTETVKYGSVTIIDREGGSGYEYQKCYATLTKEWQRFAYEMPIVLDKNITNPYMNIGAASNGDNIPFDIDNLVVMVVDNNGNETPLFNTVTFDNVTTSEVVPAAGTGNSDGDFWDRTALGANDGYGTVAELKVVEDVSYYTAPKSSDTAATTNSFAYKNVELLAGCEYTLSGSVRVGELVAGDTNQYTAVMGIQTEENGELQSMGEAFAISTEWTEIPEATFVPTTDTTVAALVGTVDANVPFDFRNISLVKTAASEPDQGEDPEVPTPTPTPDTTEGAVELELVVKDATDKDGDTTVDIDRTFKVDIIACATGEDVDISGSGFTVAYDSEQLTLVGLTSGISEAAIDVAKSSFQFANAEAPITVTSNGVTLATAEFTVNDGVDNAVGAINLNGDKADLVIKELNADTGFQPKVTAANVELHNIVIGVAIGENITGGDGIPEKLYANFMDSVLYTEAGEEYNMPELSAADGYRVGDWKLDGEAFTLGTDAFTKSAVLSIGAVETAVVNLKSEDANKGTLTQTSITVDADDTLWDVVNKINNETVVTPAEHYTFDDWYYNDEKIEEGNTTLARDLAEDDALVAKFTAGNVTVDITYVDYVTGDPVEAGDADVVSKVGEPLFVTPEYTTGYVVEGVTYKYNEGDEAIALTKADDSDAYVSANNLTGNVIVTVTYRKVVTVTVYTEANDETAERAKVTYYALQNKADDENGLLTGLYSDIKCESPVNDMSAVVPTYYNEAGDIEDADYRYIDDADKEALFTDGTNEYAGAAALLAASYYGDTEITPIAVKQWKITYVKGDGVATITPEYVFVTVGNAMPTEKPEVTTTVEGYIVNWAEYDAATADAAKSITISASAKSVKVTYTNADTFLELVTATDSGLTAVPETENEYTADCNKAAVFTLEAKAGYVVESVKYNGNDLNADDNGNYTIPASALTTDIEIVAVAKKADFTLTLPEGWTYTVGGEAATEETKIHIDDTVVITPKADAVIVCITVTVEDGETYTLTADEDGKYTLDGSKTIGNVTVTENGLADGVDIDFISANDYKALDAGTQIVKVTGVASTATVTMGGKDLYWSERYGAHIMIVGATETVATLANGMEIDDTKSADVVDYSGDINDDGSVNVVDAAIVSELLLYPSGRDAYSIMRLRADVTGEFEEGEDGAYVDVTDCQWILSEDLNS